MMARTGKRSLKRRIADYQVQEMDIEVAQAAKLLNARYSAADAGKISKGVATFFAWVSFYITIVFEIGIYTKTQPLIG